MRAALCGLLDKDVYDKRDFIPEGGSSHVDGQGTCAVTESCLLNNKAVMGKQRAQYDKGME